MTFPYTSRFVTGILADEMGLGKTIQTIALLAHLASERFIWGPHLIVVPTSTLLNWETEFRKWAPAFKIVTYYGSAKARKAKRVGWSKPNAFHVCITSYQLVVQDASVFRRKKWFYLILDEAHYIKNFQSQRWQTLLHFASKRRLLLTGTPLQNSLMELWSLMHFLMPHLFRSQSEFRYWFSTPLTAQVEGGARVNSQLVRRLHSVLRPFVLRRLKADVAKQMPGKYEHVVKCRLSRRQQFLYEEFMGRSATRASLSSGNYMSMMNVLMQLRKVCNHPDLFEPRLIVTPMAASPLLLRVPALVLDAGASATHDCRHAMQGILPRSSTTTCSTALLHLGLSAMELAGCTTASAAYARDHATPNSIITGSAQAANERRFPSLEALCAPRGGGIALGKRFVAAITEVHAAVRARQEAWMRGTRATMAAVNNRRTKHTSMPVYGADCVRAVTCRPRAALEVVALSQQPQRWGEYSDALRAMVHTPAEVYERMAPTLNRYMFFIPRVASALPQLRVSAPCNGSQQHAQVQAVATQALTPVHKRVASKYHTLMLRRRISFPDRRLLEWDCGKLQALASLLHERKRGGHRCLIFTQVCVCVCHSVPSLDTLLTCVALAPPPPPPPHNR